MKNNDNRLPVNLKIFLISFALLIAAGTLIYTQSIVKQLQSRERALVQLYANGIQYITDINRPNSDLTFIFENIIKRIDFPLILSDRNDNVNLSGQTGGYKNIEIDSSLTKNELKQFFADKINELRKLHDPILVTYQDSVVHILTKIYYGDSQVITKLKFYPYLQIFIGLLFVLLAYFGFSYVKKTEQSNIWVGMAKETAHQLGTPISSLMGWTELLKLNYNNPDKVLDVAEETGDDLKRLTKITNRFSKIGSKPELKEENISKVIENVISYFNKRLPQTKRNVQINLVANSEFIINLNASLFEWVIENLIKNALDAIEHKHGEIIISIKEEGQKIAVEVTDNGKGIDLKRRKEIFRPGFSTKSRGWGLGLSLTKRIIENYHDGKIFLKHSILDEGSTFKILLNK